MQRSHQIYEESRMIHVNFSASAMNDLKQHGITDRSVF